LPGVTGVPAGGTHTDDRRDLCFGELSIRRTYRCTHYVILPVTVVFRYAVERR
jgi:hypothetical protein